MNRFPTQKTSLIQSEPNCLSTKFLSSVQGNTSSASSAGIGERARHPDEVKSEDSRWLVDIDYYLAQQIHPVVSRLCAEIQGTSPERLAECLGLDPSKVKQLSFKPNLQFHIR